MEFVQIVFQLLFFTICSSAIGEPWRIIIRKFTGIFGDLDFLQVLLLDIYLGGFLLYTIAIVPLQLFNVTVLYAVTVASIVTVLLFHQRRFMSVFQILFRHPKLLFQRRHSSEYVLVTLIFVSSFITQTLPLSGLLLGSVRDTGIHSLFVRVILENRQVPVTLAPYLGEGIIYPQGFSPIAAYATLLLGYSPPQAVLYITSFFNVLTILGAYFLGKTLSKSDKWLTGLSMAFVFAFVATYPKYITWGSNALVASFPFYFICLSLFSLLCRHKSDWKTILVVGLLFGYLSVLHLQVFETLIASLFVLWLYVAVRKDRARWPMLRNLMAVSVISIIVLSPFIIRQLAFYANPYHNIGVPADAEIPVPQPSLAVVLTSAKWLLENLAVDPLLKVAFFALIFISGALIIAFRKTSANVGTNDLVKLGVATLLGQLCIALLAGISPQNLPFYPQPLMLYIPLYFFIAALTYLLYRHFSAYLTRKIAANKTEINAGRKQLLITVISLMLLLGVYAPFLGQSLAFDSGRLYGSYAVFSITTEQDLQLILWIRDHLPENATVLVSSFQSGTFIPSIAGRKAVFPSFGSSTSISYQRLVNLLERNVVNATTMALMRRFNITDVYVGSGISPWDDGIHKWNPRLFLGNPRFTLLKNFGNAYLFRCNYIDTNVTFLDDFDHPVWNDDGWQTEYIGNGIGNVTAASDYGLRSSHCLRITTQAIYSVSEWEYGRVVSREFFVANDSDVIFSFYLNASEGFHGKDTFAVIVSNIYRNESIIMTTPNGIYAGYANSQTLSGFEGTFEYDLTTSWQQCFNRSLPEVFVIELVNLDFDGIRNVAYVDNISITCKSIP